MGLLSLAFISIPFIPGINALPRKIPIYKLIWREHYRDVTGRARREVAACRRSARQERTSTLGSWCRT